MNIKKFEQMLQDDFNQYLKEITIRDTAFHAYEESVKQEPLLVANRPVTLFPLHPTLQ